MSDEVTTTRYASAMIVGASIAVEEAGRSLIISEASATPLGRHQASRTLLDAGADGLLVGFIQARLVELSEAARSARSVVVNATAPGRHSVLPGEYEAGRTAAEYLLGHGHTRIGLIGRHWAQADPYWSVTVSRRFAGVDDVMAGAGLTFEVEYEVEDWEPDQGYEGALEMLETSEITAIIAGNDRLAFGVYNAAAKLGLSIPKDISVMSFDDDEIAAYLQPGLTTIALPYEEMGRVAANLLLDVLDGKEDGRACGEPACEVLVPTRLVERGSVADVP